MGKKRKSKRSKGHKTELAKGDAKKFDKAPQIPPEETQAELVRYYTNVMNDTKQENRRRDKAAACLNRLVNTNMRLQMRVITRTKPYEKPVKQGKKQHRAEVAAQTATEDNEWSHLIPKAEVVSLADRKKSKGAR